jgi:hypothetical protein
MMRDRRRQWIDPYPKWTPAESQWAHIWLVAVVLLVLVGILYGSINVYIVEQELVRFRRFPVVDEMYPVALTAAQEENLDARLAAVEIVSYEGTYEEALEYEVRFYFCSPTDQAWALEVGALRHFRLLREDVELRRMRNVSRSSTIFSGLACDDYSIEEMAYDIEYVSEGMRLALSEGRLENWTLANLAVSEPEQPNASATRQGEAADVRG